MDRLSACHAAMITIKKTHELDASILCPVDHFRIIHYFLLVKATALHLRLRTKSLTYVVGTIIRGQEDCRRRDLAHFAKASYWEFGQFRCFPLFSLGR